MLCLLWMCISQWSCSYDALIYWNAKNYNNGININMVSEPTWRKHISQEEKRHCYRTQKLGFCKSESFQLPNHLESCALPQGSFWHLEHTFSVARSPGKWNPSFTKYQKTRKPEYQKYQKYQSTRSTRKPEAPVQKSADQIWRSKSWIFEIPTAPTNSPQLSASIPWIRISKFKVWKIRVSS
jgi:hypothetical protein